MEKFIYNSVQMSKFYFCIFGVMMFPVMLMFMYAHQNYELMVILFSSFLFNLVGAAYFTSKNKLKTFLD